MICAFAIHRWAAKAPWHSKERSHNELRDRNVNVTSPELAGKPQQNGLIESFNGSLRDELLNEEIFDTLDDARRKLAL